MVKEKDWTLSDKKWNPLYNELEGEVIKVKDVKEFIQLEGVIFTEFIVGNITVGEFVDKRKALAGKELVE